MKKLIFITFMLFLTTNIFSKDLSGIWKQNSWSANKSESYTNFSWGKENYLWLSYDLSIDEINKKIWIQSMGEFEITNIEETSDSEYILTYYFDRGNFDVKYQITFLTDKELIINVLTKEGDFISGGEDNHYYRISGPKDVPQYSKPITAIYLGETTSETPLKKNEKIQLIGGNVHLKKRNEVIKYRYVTENNEYGYVETSLIEILDVDLGIVMKSNENLRIREEETTSSKIIVTIMKDTNVKILKLGKEDNIDGINSKWVQVEIQNGSKDRDGKEIKEGTVGWCFGGYLE